MATLEVLYTDDNVTLDKRVMDNGEIRIRTACGGGSAFIRTIGGPEQKWQKAHHHRHGEEFYVVIDGWMVVAEKRPLGSASHEFHLQILWPGQTYLSRRGVDHNILARAGANIDTLKYLVTPIGPGDKGNDYYESDPDFDRWTKELTLAGIAERSGVLLSDLE